MFLFLVRLCHTRLTEYTEVLSTDMQIKQYVFVSSIFINKYVYFYFWGTKIQKKKKLRIISAGKYGFASVVSKHKNNSSAAGTLSDSNYGYKTNY